MIPIFIKLTETGKINIFLNVCSIESYKRESDNKTYIWCLGSSADNHYIVQETPEQILELIDQALEKQPKLATEEHLTRIETILREKWSK